MSISPTSNEKSYLDYITIITVVSIIAVTCLLIFRPGDNGYVTLLGFAGIMVTNLLSGEATRNKVQGVHDMVNSRMTQLLTASNSASKAEGVAEGIATNQNKEK